MNLYTWLFALHTIMCKAFVHHNMKRKTKTQNTYDTIVYTHNNTDTEFDIIEQYK